MTEFTFRKKFVEQLSDLLEGEINLIEAITILKRVFKGKYKEKIQKLKLQLEKGKDLDVAFLNISKDKEFLSFIKTSQKTGDLKGCMKLLKEKYQFISQIKSEIISIIIYPLVVISTAIIILNVLLMVVVPKFIEIYKDLDQELPNLTKSVINISEFLLRFKLHILLVFLSLIVLITYLIKSNNIIYHSIILKNSLIRDYHILGFTQTMYAAFASKIIFLDALKICMDTNNQAFKYELQKIFKKIEKGDSITMAFEKAKYFDIEYKNYISIADATGEVEKVFKTLTTIKNNRLRYKIRIYLKFLEPISIMIIALFVGLIVLAIMLPLFNLGESIM